MYDEIDPRDFPPEYITPDLIPSSLSLENALSPAPSSVRPPFENEAKTVAAALDQRMEQMMETFDQKLLEAANQ